MPIGEYITLFAAILVGLAVADLSLSLHKLLRVGRDIHWHLIVPVTGFIILCLILNLWWGLYRSYSELTSISFVEFLPQVGMLLTLFLLAASVFPDDKLPKGSSLHDYYVENRTLFWGLFALYLGFVLLNGAIGAFKSDKNIWDFLQQAWGNMLALLFCLWLTRSKKMLLHWLMIGYILYSIVISWFVQTLQQGAAT